MASLKNWIKKNIVSKHLMKGCPEEQKCLQLLEVILDNESTNEEKEKYFEHIDICWTCFENYNIETAIRELLKTKIENKQVPEGLISKIQAEIDKTATI